MLIASHIKPWREASNAERLSGCNGLLLSPHVDALFDEQFITFDDDGRMHVHPSLSRDVLDRRSIDPDKKVGAFGPGKHRSLRITGSFSPERWHPHSYSKVHPDRQVPSATPVHSQRAPSPSGLHCGGQPLLCQ
ncbi:HNH endonuclease [Rhodanobacter umsongensis]